MRFADWIKASGLRRIDVSRQLGLSPGHITDLCNDRIWPSREIALKIWRYTDGEVTPNDFLRSPGEDEQL